MRTTGYSNYSSNSWQRQRFCAGGRFNIFSLFFILIQWLRCEGKEVERPKKEDKVKEVKKKEIKDDRKEKDNKYKKGKIYNCCTKNIDLSYVDRREEDENRKIGGEGNSLSISTHCSNSILEERPLTPPLKRRDEEIKKNLVKPLPADLLGIIYTR